METKFPGLGNRIEDIRRAKGMNKTEFGALFGASGSLVNKWEKSTVVPNEERLVKISEFGDISLNDLLYGSLENVIYDIMSDVVKLKRINIPVSDLTSKEGELLKRIEMVVFSSFRRKQFHESQYWNNDIDFNSLSDSDKRELINKRRVEEHELIQHLINISVVECEEKNVSVSNRIGILECMENAIRRYAYEEEYTTEGLINFLYSALDYALMDAVSYVFLPNSEVERSSVDSEISEKAFSIVTNAMNELDELGNKLT